MENVFITFSTPIPKTKNKPSTATQHASNLIEKIKWLRNGCWNIKISTILSPRNISYSNIYFLLLLSLWTRKMMNILIKTWNVNKSTVYSRHYVFQFAHFISFNVVHKMWIEFRWAATVRRVCACVNEWIEIAIISDRKTYTLAELICIKNEWDPKYTN